MRDTNHTVGSSLEANSPYATTYEDLTILIRTQSDHADALPRRLELKTFNLVPKNASRGRHAYEYKRLVMTGALGISPES